MGRSDGQSSSGVRKRAVARCRASAIDSRPRSGRGRKNAGTPARAKTRESAIMGHTGVPGTEGTRKDWP